MVFIRMTVIRNHKEKSGHSISLANSLPRPGGPPRLCPTLFICPPTLLTVAFPYEWLVFAHASQLLKFSQTSNS